MDGAFMRERVWLKINKKVKESRKILEIQEVNGENRIKIQGN